MNVGHLILLAALLEPSPAPADAGIRVSAEAATAEIVPGDAGRRLVPLPTLAFALVIEPRCEAGARAELLSVGVADSRTTFDAAALDRGPVIDTRFEVPDRQLAPVAVEGFCPTEPGDDELEQLLVPAALTAQVSLRCAADDGGRWMHYHAVPLDVRLICQPRAGAAASGTNARG